MSRRFAVPTCITAIVLLVGTGAYIRTGMASSDSSPAAVYGRSIGMMSQVRDVHGVGTSRETEVEFTDLHSRGFWRVQGDCVTRPRSIVARFTIRGSQSGRHARAVDEQFTIVVPGSPASAVPPTRDWKVWFRADTSRLSRPKAAWRRITVTHDALVVASMCPSLVVPGLHNRSAGSFKALGTVMVSGRRTVHLQSAFNGHGGGSTVDLYVDTETSRWLRVGLSGWGAGCCHSYATSFDLSRFNKPVALHVP
jgi:hypothetical protein